MLILKTIHQTPSITMVGSVFLKLPWLEYFSIVQIIWRFKESKIYQSQFQHNCSWVLTSWFLTIIASLKLVSINNNYFAEIVRISVLDLGYICSNSRVALFFVSFRRKSNVAAWIRETLFSVFKYYKTDFKLKCELADTYLAYAIIFHEIIKQTPLIWSGKVLEEK